MLPILLPDNDRHAVMNDRSERIRSAHYDGQLMIGSPSFGFHFPQRPAKVVSEPSDAGTRRASALKSDPKQRSGLRYPTPTKEDAMSKAAVIGNIVIASLIFSSNATAHSPTKEECAEGSDFIKNAALSRENGMDATTFITKLLDDFVLIKSFPVELRWFIQDPQDEEFLLKAATDVFEHPKEPDVHQRNFLGECIIRTSSNQKKIIVGRSGQLE